MEQESKTVSQIIEEVKGQMCDKYCKYPNIWDEEKEGQLYDSDICNNCPMNKL